VGAVFDAAGEQGIGVRAVTRAEDVASLRFPTEALGRLGAAIDDGWVAVVPERPVTLDRGERVGWWLVDPASGRTSDQLDDGRGAAAERVIVNVVYVESIPAYARLGSCIGLAALGMTAGFLIVLSGFSIAKGNWLTAGLAAYGVSVAVPLGFFVGLGCF
jgi:hypothetical protein